MIYLLIGTNFFWLILLIFLQSAKSTPKAEKPSWVVNVRPAGVEYDEHIHSKKVTVEVVQRSKYDGERFVVGQVAPNDPEFELKLAQLKAEAEEQATKLHVTGVR